MLEGWKIENGSMKLDEGLGYTDRSDLSVCGSELFALSLKLSLKPENILTTVDDNKPEVLSL